MSHIISVLIRATIGFFVAAFAWGVLTVAYWLYWPYTVAQLEQPIKVLNINNEVEPGGRIDLLIRVSKTGDYQVDRDRIVRGLQCPNGAFYGVEPEDSAINLPVGQFERVRGFKLTEAAVQVEDCNFIFRLEYPVNPLRVIVETWVSENIDIVEVE